MEYTTQTKTRHNIDDVVKGAVADGWKPILQSSTESGGTIWVTVTFEREKPYSE